MIEQVSKYEVLVINLEISYEKEKYDLVEKVDIKEKELEEIKSEMNFFVEKYKVDLIELEFKLLEQY